MMKELHRYLKIFIIAFKARLIHETEYRVNLIMSFVGSFVFVFLNYFIVYFFVQKFAFPNWGAKEMQVLMGCFLIIYYSIFYFYHRGIVNLITNIRSGKLDHFLLKPIDYQFSILTYGGGMNNLIAMIFGIVLFTKSSLVFDQQYLIFRYAFSIILSFIGTFDFYCFLLLLASLNFRFGYIDEIVSFAYSLQGISRFPTEAFTHLPVFLLLFAIPLSALTTIPALVIVAPSFPILEATIYIIFSIGFSYLSRRVFLKAIRSYSSGS